MRFSFLSAAAASSALVISIPFSSFTKGDETTNIPQSAHVNMPCTGQCSPPPSSLDIDSIPSLELRTPHSHHKYDNQDPPPPPHIPTTWKVAIGVNAFVLIITASILGMLVWILRKEYKKRRLAGEGYVGAKDGFGRRMKSARRARTRNGGRQRAWSYDPIREEEEESENGVALARMMEDSNGEDNGNGKQVTMPEKDKMQAKMPMGKAKKAWGGRHVRFQTSNGDPRGDARGEMSVVTSSSGKEERVLELRNAEQNVDVHTP